MARRRKDILKKRSLGDQDTSAPSTVGRSGPEDEAVPPDRAPRPETVVFDERLEEPRRPALPSQASAPARAAVGKEGFLLGLLVLYVLLLGLGTAGELFEIEWILNLPLFK